MENTKNEKNDLTINMYPKDMDDLQPWENIAPQFQVGQYFINSSRGIMLLNEVKDGMLRFEGIKVIKGKKKYPIESFAKLLLNKYFDQISNPNSGAEYELHAKLGLNRYMK